MAGVEGVNPTVIGIRSAALTLLKVDEQGVESISFHVAEVLIHERHQAVVVELLKLFDGSGFLVVSLGEHFFQVVPDLGKSLGCSLV